MGLLEDLRNTIGPPSMGDVDLPTVDKSSSSSSYTIDQWQPIITTVEEDHPNIPRGVIRSLIERESSGNPNATVDTGKHWGQARGLGQFIDSTAEQYIPGWTGPQDSYDPQKNIQGIGNYLDDLIQKTGDVRKALIKYHGGGTDIFGTRSDDYADEILTKGVQNVTSSPAPTHEGTNPYSSLEALFGVKQGATIADELSQPVLAQQMDQVVDEPATPIEQPNPRAPDWQRTAFPLSTAVAEGGKPSLLRTAGANLAAGVDAVSWPFRAVDAAVNKGSEIINPAVNRALGTNLVSWNEAKEGIANQIPGDGIIAQNLRTGVDMALSSSSYVGGGAIRKAVTDIPKRMEQQMAKDLAVKLPKKTVEEMDKVVESSADQVDFEATLQQNFKAPKEGKTDVPISKGGVFGKVEVSADQMDHLSQLPGNSVTKYYLENVPDDRWIVSIDGDYFKAVNDTQGHKEGDKVITQIGQIINKYFPDKFRGREGGEEFVIGLGKDLTKADIEKVKAMHAEIASTIKIDGAPFTASVGIGRGRSIAERGDLRHNSDITAYLAKDAGRNQIAIDYDGKIEYLSSNTAGDKPYVVEHAGKQLSNYADILVKSGRLDAGTAQTLRDISGRVKGATAKGGRGVPAAAPDGAIVSGIGSEDISGIPPGGSGIGGRPPAAKGNSNSRYPSGKQRTLSEEEQASLVEHYDRIAADAQPTPVDDFFFNKSDDEARRLIAHDSDTPLTDFPEDIRDDIATLRKHDYEDFVRAGQGKEINRLQEEIQRQQKLYNLVPELRKRISKESLNAAGDPNKQFENLRWISDTGGKDLDRARMDFIADHRGDLADLGISEESLATPTDFMNFLDGLPTRETINNLKRELKAVDSEDYVKGMVGKYGVPKEAGKIPEPEMMGAPVVAEPRFSSETGDLFAGTDQEVKPDLLRAEQKRREAAAPEQKSVTDLPLFDTQAQQGAQQGLKLSEKEPNPFTMGGITEDMAGRIKYAASTNLFREDVSNAVKKEWLDMTADYRSKFDEKNLRGTTHKMIQEIADGMGSKDIAKKLMKRTKDENFNVFELKASRDLVAQHMVEREKMTKEILNKGGIDALSAEDKVKYLSELEMQMMLASQVNGLRSNAGHLLQSLRMMSKARKEYKSAQDLLDVWHGNNTGDEILRRFVELGSAPEAAKAQSKFLNRAMFAKAPDKIYRYYIESILSAIPTDAANVIGNAATAGIRQTVGRAAGIAAENISTGIRNIGRAAQGKELAKPTMHVGEISHAMAGMFKSFGPALKEAGRSLLTGESRFGRTPVEAEFIQPKGKALSRAAAVLPTRRLQAADTFFKTINFSAEVHAQAYRKAMNEGLRGEALQKRIDEIVQSPELFNDVYEPAWADAQKQTFTDKPGEATRALSNFRRKWGLRWVIPFINTPIKILNYGMEWTPGASAWMLRNKLRRADLTREQKMDEIGKTVVSHLAAIPLVMAAKSGLITGAPPTDSAERKAKEATGWRPYSIKVGDKYVQYQRIEPLATVLGVTSDFVNTLDDLDETKMSDLAGRVVYAIQQNVLNKTFFTQLANFVEAATDKSGDRLKRFVNTFAGAFVPNILNRGAAVSDPNYREADDVGDVLKSRIPGASQTLFPKRDVWGEPEEKSMHGWYGFFSPIATSKEKKNPVFDEVARLKLSIGKPSKKISGVELSEAQYDEYQEMAGKAAYEKVSSIVQGSRYKNADEETQKEMIRDLITDTREVARESMLRKYRFKKAE